MDPDDFLFHGSQKSLRIEEIAQIEGSRSLAFKPTCELLVPIHQRRDPGCETRFNPGDLCTGRVIKPKIGDFAIENRVDRIHDLRSHYYLPVHGLYDIVKCLFHEIKHEIHSLNFLE